MMQIRGIGADRGEGELKLADVPAEIGEEPIVDQSRRDIVRAPRQVRSTESVALSGEFHTGPEGGGGVRQPEVDIAMRAECGEYEQMVRIESSGAEDRQPLREITGLRRKPQPGERGLHPFGRAGHTKLIAQPSPEFGLPGTVGRQRRSPDVDVAPLGPTVDHGRSGRGVPGEETGQMLRGGPAPSCAERVQVGRASAGAQVVPQQCRPRLAAAAVDHSKERPHYAVRLPRIGILLVGAAGQGAGHQSSR